MLASLLSDWRLYWRYVGVSIRAQMQYRASFVMLSLGGLIMNGLEFLGIWALFARFGNLRGWTLPEAALFYGLVGTAFALSEAVARGFDTFGDLVRTGDFDRLLLRPRSLPLQVAGRDMQLMRAGRIAQALVIMVWSLRQLHLAWTWWRPVVLMGAIFGGMCLFSGLFILQATMCFWTVESIEIVNTTTYGGVETAQFPMTIYRDWFRKFFTYVVPLATITYFPAVALLGRTDPLGSSLAVQALAPLAGVLFLLGSLQAWRIGVRHYHSTGS